MRNKEGEKRGGGCDGKGDKEEEVEDYHRGRQEDNWVIGDRKYTLVKSIGHGVTGNHE